MKIVSWNLLHRTGATLDEVEHLIQQEKPDLLLMQETTARIDRLPGRVGGHYARNPLPGRHHGLAAWSPAPLQAPARAVRLQSGLLIRRICQIVELDGFTVANVHLSHGQILNRRQLRRIASILPARAAVVGDCNMVGPSLLPDFQDVGPLGATHIMGDMVPLRLDRCFVRGLTCEGAEALGRATSDHRPIAVRLSVPAAAQQAA